MTSIAAHSHDIYIFPSSPIPQIHRLAEKMLSEARIIRCEMIDNFIRPFPWAACGVHFAGLQVLGFQVEMFVRLSLLGRETSCY